MKPSPVPESVAILSLLQATSAPLAVFDETGRCLGATEGFRRRLGAGEIGDLVLGSLDLPRSAEVTPFSPGGGRAWRLVTLCPAQSARDDGPGRQVLDELPAIVAVKGCDFRYRFLNRYGQRFFGLTLDQAIGRTDAELLGPELGDFLQRCDDYIISGNHALPPFGEKFAGADGVLRDWMITGVPRHDDEGRITGVVMVALDVSEFSRRTEAIRPGVGETESLPARFLSSVGLQLRAPLTSIIGYAEFLAEQGLGPLGHDTYREFARDLVMVARTLQARINDILDMAAIQAGRLSLDAELFDVSRTISQVHRTLEAAALQKHLVVVEAVERGLPSLMGDPRRIRQMYTNLLSNAIKFTPDYGRITLSAAISAADELVLSVRDNGVGIAADALAKVVTPFVQVSHLPALREEGTGLGLPLAKAIAEAHGGRLELESEPGRGTEVRVYLPVDRRGRAGN